MIAEMGLHRLEDHPTHRVGSAAEEKFDLMFVELRRPFAEIPVGLIVEIPSIVGGQIIEPGLRRRPELFGSAILSTR